MSDYNLGPVITRLQQNVTSLELEVLSLKGKVERLEATDRISAGTICAGTISVEEINETKEIRKFYHSSDSEFITVVAGTDTCTIVSQSDHGVEIKQLRMLDEEQPRYQDGLKY